MRDEVITWLGAEAGLREVPATSAEALARGLGLPPNDRRVGRLLRAAQGGRTASLDLPDGRRLLLAPSGNGTARGFVAQALPATELAGAVSHEVANALGAIVGWAKMARERLGQVPPDDALRIIEASARAAQLYADQLVESVRGSPEDARTAVRPVLQEIADLLAPEAESKGVRIELTAPRGVAVRASRADLFAVLGNLGRNAIQACQRGGRVRLEGIPMGRGVIFVVEDDGAGMTEEVARHAFDPYFTRREGGTGLGLALVRRTIDRLGGRLDLDTSPGRGTRFRIELPRTQARSDEIPVAPSNANASAGTMPTSSSGVVSRAESGARILVVEDDRATRELVATTLEMRGAIPTTAASPEEALTHRGPFDLAVIDLNLRSGRGDLLLGALRSAGVVRLGVMMSGGEPPPDMVPAGTPDTWVRKPFDPDELLSAVRELLRATSAAAESKG